MPIAYQFSTGAATLASDLGPTATNRAGIYYCEGDLTLSGDRTINGTLIIRGNLICNGSNIKITAADGYPELMLNDRPLFHYGTLDQGYWPDGVLTPPSDEARCPCSGIWIQKSSRSGER